MQLNVKPLKMQNGDSVSYYTDVIDTLGQIFTFPTSQERIIVKNKGVSPITYMIGTKTGTLGPSESIEVNETITQFTLTASQKTQQFEVWSDELTALSSGGSDSGSGILSYSTLTDLQNTYPNGLSYPVWVSGDSSWYYWNGPVIDTTAPVLSISPNGSTFPISQSVTMSTNETADIFYTLDGTTPTVSSTKYTSAITLNATTTLKAFAKDTAGNQSSVQTLVFTKDITAPADTTPPTVTATPAAGTYSSNQTVSLSTEAGATIYYTTDGTTPTTASTVYSSPIPINATTTLQFIGKDAVGNISTPVAAAYTINLTDPNLIVSDKFNRLTTAGAGLGTADTGQVWGGNLAYTSNNGYAAGSSSSLAAPVINLNQGTNVDISVDINSPNFGIRPIGIRINANSDGTGGITVGGIATNGTTAGGYDISTATSYGSAAYTWALNTPNTLRVTIQNGTVTLFVNGTQITSFAQPAAINANTYFGIYDYNSNAPHFSNFVAKKIA